MKDHEISDMSHVYGEDGKSVELTIETNNGATLPVKVPYTKLTNLIEHLTRIGADAARHRTGGRAILFAESRPTIVGRTLLTGMAVAASPDGSQRYVVLRLWDMDLSFEVTMPTLESFAVAIADVKKDRDDGLDKMH
jgi:hypothetical protein